MFSYTLRPRETASTTVAKLSSASIMSAAFLATSVPLPIAQPMSARLSAGASLTPSPVIATTAPFFCQASTMRSLSAGVTRAYTAMSGTSFASVSSSILSRYTPSTARSFSSFIPSDEAISVAVARLSPVIITGLIPAALQVLTAFSASLRGGSAITNNPTMLKSDSSLAERGKSAPTFLTDSASTLKPRRAYTALCRSNRA